MLALFREIPRNYGVQVIGSRRNDHEASVQNRTSNHQSTKHGTKLRSLLPDIFPANHRQGCRDDKNVDDISGVLPGNEPSKRLEDHEQTEALRKRAPPAGNKTKWRKRQRSKPYSSWPVDEIRGVERKVEREKEKANWTATHAILNLREKIVKILNCL